MVTINPNTFEAMSKAFYAVDKNDLRPMLQHIEIVKVDDKAVITSSNGYIAFKKQVMDDGLQQILSNVGGKMYIHVDQWPALKLIAKSKYAVEASCGDDLLTTSIANVKLSNVNEYPDIDKIMTKMKGETLGTITFNQKQLEALCKALVRKSTKTQTITMTIPTSDTQAMVVTSTDETETSMLMPIKLNKEEK